MATEIVRKFEAKMDELGYPTYKSMDNIYMDIRTRSLFEGYKMGYSEAVKEQQMAEAIAVSDIMHSDSINEIEDGFDEDRNEGLHYYGEL